MRRGWHYLGLDVVKRRRAHDGEADEKDVGLRVRQRAQTVVILLSGGIPKSETYGLAVDHNICGVVIKARGASARVSGRSGTSLHSGDVFAGEGIGCVRDEKACLRR